jgi:Ulp1 family protease
LIAILPPRRSVPQQRNGFDCGGFVCRVAYGVYRLRHKVFSFGEANYDERNGSKCNKKLFKSFLAEQPGFVRNEHVGDQNATDAAQRIRKEMMKLIENLSIMYHQRKQRVTDHKLLMRLEACAAKSVVKNKEVVHKDMVHSKKSSNKVPRPMQSDACHAEAFHGSGSGENLQSQRVSVDIVVDTQQQKKTKQNVSLKNANSKHQKRSAKNGGKRRRTRLNHSVHPKKKNRFS